MQQKITLKWQTTARPHSMNTMHDTVKRIHERTNGQVAIELYGQDEVVPQFDIFPGVQSGQLDMGYTVSGYGKSATLLPRSGVGELPLWPSGKAGVAFVNAVLDKYIRGDMQGLGVEPLFYEINFACDWGWFVPPYITDLWCNKMYTSLEELKGARIVSQCWTTSEALRLIGMVPVEKPFHELSKLFANDEVDGALVTSFCLLALGCNDKYKSLVRIGFPQSEDAFTFMNKKVYDSLPADARNVIIEEVRDIWKTLDRRGIIKRSTALLDKLVQEGKLKIIELPPSEQAFCKKMWEENLTNAWIKKQEATGLKGAKAYVEDLKKMAADILASGVPNCEEAPLR